MDLLFEVGAKLFASDAAFGDGFGGRLLGILFVVELELVALDVVFGSGFDKWLLDALVIVEIKLFSFDDVAFAFVVGFVGRFKGFLLYCLRLFNVKDSK